MPNKACSERLVVVVVEECDMQHFTQEVFLVVALVVVLAVKGAVLVVVLEVVSLVVLVVALPVVLATFRAPALDKVIGVVRQLAQVLGRAALI